MMTRILQKQLRLPHVTDHTRKFLPTLDCYPFDFQIADFNGDNKKDIYICALLGEDILLMANDE